jgi:hypothetical protein
MEGVEVPEKCRKCNGFVVFEIILGEDGWVHDVRCVNCGERFFDQEETLRIRSRRYYGRQRRGK